MTDRTRNFLAVSGLVVVVGLCTGLVAYYNTNLPARRSTFGPPELTYIPTETTVLAYADVREIMESDFRGRLRDVLPTGDGKDRLLEETGIDVEADIDSVLISVGRNRNSVALIRGRFKNDDVEARATAKGVAAEQYRGVRLLVAPADSGPAGLAERPSAPAVAFLEPGLVAIGDVDAVKLAIDTASGSSDVTKNATLMRSVSDVQNEGNAWVVGDFEALSAQAGDAAERLRSNIPPVKWFALSAQVDRNLDLRIHAEALDAEAGNQLRTMVNGLVETGKMMLGSDPQAASLLNSVRATGTEHNVDITLTLSPEVLNFVRDTGGRFVRPGSFR